MEKHNTSSPASRVSVSETRDAVRGLVALNLFVAALRTLQLALASARNVLECQAVAELFELVPERVRSSDPTWAVVQVKALCFARRPETLERVAGAALERWGESAGSVRPYQAWALARQRASAQAALEVADAVIAARAGFPSYEIGLAWRARAEALAWLDIHGWREAFARARGVLTGRSLGTCLIAEGFHLDRRNESVAARRVWLQAAAILRDPYYEAWVQYNLGISFLKEAAPEAEAHFLRLEGLTRRGVGAGFAARAWCGLGASRRALGEWDRAQGAYATAIRLAHEDDDALEAWRGLGHTLRLAGDWARALEALHKAVDMDRNWVTEGRSWVMVDLAAARLSMGDEEGAREALDHARAEDQDDRDRERIVRAELHRRAGEADAALETMAGVELGTLCAREERACFPAVFALLEALTGRAPAVLKRASGTVVEVRAMGVLEVRVNARRVPISPTSIVGELLVLLVHNGGALSTEVLLDALYAHQGVERRARQALSRQVRALREALGWVGSVVEVGGAYRLDAGTTWRYDVIQAREAGRPVARFLDGVYREWALETARQLETNPRDLN